jgi:hypothetical protein
MFGTCTQPTAGAQPLRSNGGAVGAPPRAVRADAGFGMVSALLALSLLAVFALVAAAVAVNERRSALNEELHTGAFMSADSGGEAAINWLRARDQPPPINNFATRQVANPAETTLRDSQRYQYQVTMPLNGPTGLANPQPRPGYGVNTYRDFIYNVNSRGEAGVEGQSNVGMTVNKLTRLGY